MTSEAQGSFAAFLFSKHRDARSGVLACSPCAASTRLTSMCAFVERYPVGMARLEIEITRDFADKGTEGPLAPARSAELIKTAKGVRDPPCLPQPTPSSPASSSSALAHGRLAACGTYLQRPGG